MGCDIFVDFVKEVESVSGEFIKDYNGNMLTTTSGHTVIQISTSNGLSYEQLVSTATHELGHAFGLGHYITDEDELVEQWDQGINIPSIMIEDAISVGTKQITELDLKKMITLYGMDGFEKLPIQIPEWIQNIFKWYGEGIIEDQELINTIQYLAENGIISIT